MHLCYAKWPVNLTEAHLFMQTALLTYVYVAANIYLFYNFQIPIQTFRNQRHSTRCKQRVHTHMQNTHRANQKRVSKRNFHDGQILLLLYYYIWFLEHQVIQIQTQQAPIPSQAEVVLSDGKSRFIINPYCFLLFYVYVHIIEFS